MNGWARRCVGCLFDGWPSRVSRSLLSAHANMPPSPRRRSPSAGPMVARGAPPACVRGACLCSLVCTLSPPVSFLPSLAVLSCVSVLIFSIMQSRSRILDRGGQGRQEGHQVAAKGRYGTQVGSSLLSFLVSFLYASLVLSSSVYCRRRYVRTHAATHMQSPCLS